MDCGKVSASGCNMDFPTMERTTHYLTGDHHYHYHQQKPNWFVNSVSKKKIKTFQYFNIFWEHFLTWTMILFSYPYHGDPRPVCHQCEVDWWDYRSLLFWILLQIHLSSSYSNINGMLNINKLQMGVEHEMFTISVKLTSENLSDFLILTITH